jgi:5-formyltetrahydrofolate cyclo-ligase
MLKKELRSIYRQKRKALTPAEKNKLDDLLLIQFQTIPLPPIQSILAYAAIDENNEPPTDLMVDYLQYTIPGLQIAYPKTDIITQEMQAILTDEHSFFEKTEWNIPEPIDGTTIAPEQLELIFIPLLTFDKQGYRVGYGKGFYDKYLADCPAGIIKIGISYFEPTDEITDRNNFDVPLSYCITPYNTYVF